jgi:hypothetical protein
MATSQALQFGGGLARYSKESDSPGLSRDYTRNDFEARACGAIERRPSRTQEIFKPPADRKKSRRANGGELRLA